MLHGRLLAYLDEVARTGSIRKAAANLNVASSAVNRQILALEAELGVPLFDRLPRKLRLTAAGEVLIQHVRATLREHHRMRERIKHLSDPRYASVSIATVSGLAGDLLALALDQVRLDKPKARFAITVGSTDDILNAVIAGDADLAFAFDLPPSSKVDVLASVDSPFGAVVQPGHRLADRSAIRLADLSGEMLVLPCGATPIREAVDAAAARSGLVLEPTVESDSFEFLKLVAQRDRGVAILNRLDISTSRQTGAVRFIPVVELQGQTQTLSVVRRAKAALAPLPSLVVETLRQVVHARHGDPPDVLPK